jgi:hypothetical protein
MAELKQSPASSGVEIFSSYFISKLFKFISKTTTYLELKDK